MQWKKGNLSNISSTKAAEQILRYQTDTMEAQNRKEENYKKNRAKYGTSPELMKKGNDDRLLGLSLTKEDRYDIEKVKNEGELTSYNRGYIELSNRMIQVGIISKKYTKDSLVRIGYNDAKDEHILFEDLPSQVKEDIYYLEGYKKGLEELQKNMKHR